jgi:hypothetical protein
VADRLAARGVTVILRPVHCFPDAWEKARCSDNAVAVLNAAGVSLAVAPVCPAKGARAALVGPISDRGRTRAQAAIDFSRNLRWEAGLALAKGLTASQAVAAMTTIPANFLGIQNSAGELSLGRPGTPLPRSHAARHRQGWATGTDQAGTARGSQSGGIQWRPALARVVAATGRHRNAAPLLATPARRRVTDGIPTQRVVYMRQQQGRRGEGGGGAEG